jgi:hypothetical protein
MANDLSEMFLIRADGSIDKSMLLRIAAHRARYGMTVCRQRGIASTYAAEFRAELLALWGIVRTMIGCRAARAEYAAANAPAPVARKIAA